MFTRRHIDETHLQTRRKRLSGMSCAPLKKATRVLYRVQPVLIFAVVTFVGLLTAIASWYTIDHANKMSFSAIAEDAVQRLSDRIGSHILLIKSTEALFEATGEVGSF